jgi:curved DNA-binding protein CbpA
MAAELLQIVGDIKTKGLAEAFAEAARFELDGSFRLSFQQRRAIVYFRKGKIVFAASNERPYRLFTILLEEQKIKKEMLAEFPNFLNDIEFAESLVSKNILTKQQIDEAFINQVEKITKSVLAWQDGEWNFNTLARAKENIDYEINLTDILVEHARNTDLQRINSCFPSYQEKIYPNLVHSYSIHLLPSEAFVLSRFENQPIRIAELMLICAMRESELLRILYTLWLARIVNREHEPFVFSDEQIKAIKSAHIQQKSIYKAGEPQTSAPPHGKRAQKAFDETETNQENEKEELDSYLNRIENAKDFYEVLGVAPNSSSDEIKKSYFSLAKRFHPDKFHKEKGSELHQKIQKAFSEIARAYETLKDERSRKAYDSKLEKSRVDDETTKVSGQADARKIFESGYEFMMKGEYEKAYPLIARAVSLEPNNARYRAFYGKLLAFDERQKFKAEDELQMAIKLEPQNPSYRLMLAEFYIEYKMPRRAAAELNRILEIFPNHVEARELLKKIPE